jgi:hypothetical protein
VASADGFWSYAWADHAEELRGDFNFDIARRIPPRVKADLARRNPRVVLSYLSRLEAIKHDPYPLHSDPKLVHKWIEGGKEIATSTPFSFVPEGKEEFGQFVDTVIQAYRHGIEEHGAWELLWDGTRPKAERAAQALFRSTVIHYCRAHNIDYSGEANAGRGPVDFKFSQGWTARTIVEMKLMRNSKFWDGLLAQTPQYAKSEEVDCAYFVAVGFTDTELSEARRKSVEDATEVVRERGLKLRSIIVDARRKESASKLRASSDDRDSLRTKGNTE